MTPLPLALLVPGPPGPRTTLRDRLADSLAILAALLYGGVMIPLGDATDSGAAMPWPIDVTIGGFCAIPLLGRRRWPVAVALTILPAGAFSVMATGPILVAIFTVAIRRPASVGMLLVGGHLAAGVLYYLLQPDPSFPLWVDIVMRSFTGLTAVGWGLFLRSQRDLTGRLVEQAKSHERSRIAREMHDALAHRLSMVTLHAGALEVRTDATPEEVSFAAGVIRSAAHDALQELRVTLGLLRPGRGSTPEPPQPGLTDVPDLLAGARAAGMRIGYTCRVPAAGPSSVLGRTAYRLVQEGLTNARKHAPGTSVDVLLEGKAGGELRIRVTNPLPPTRAGQRAIGSGTGLIGVGERVALTGGRVEYGADDDRFRLEAWLPWPP